MRGSAVEAIADEVYLSVTAWTTHVNGANTYTTLEFLQIGFEGAFKITLVSHTCVWEKFDPHSIINIKWVIGGSNHIFQEGGTTIFLYYGVILDYAWPG